MEPKEYSFPALVLNSDFYIENNMCSYIMVCCCVVLTCERGLAELTGGGGGRLFQLQLSLHWELWDGEGQLLAPGAPQRTQTQQAGALAASSCTGETNDTHPGFELQIIIFLFQKIYESIGVYFRVSLMMSNSGNCGLIFKV